MSASLIGRTNQFIDSYVYYRKKLKKMKKEYLFNKLVKFFLKPDLTFNAEDAALYLFSTEAVNGLWYYLKLIPSEKYGFIPQIGTFTQEEIDIYDMKILKKREAALQKVLQSPIMQKFAEKPNSTTDINWSVKKPKIIN